MASKVVSRIGGTGCGAAVQQAAHHAGGPAVEVTSAVATAAAPRESAEPAAGCRLGGGGDGVRIEDGSLAGSSSGCRDDGGRGDGIWLRRGGNDGGGGIGGGGEGGGAVVGARIASSHRGRLHHSQLGMRQYWHGGRRSGVRRRVEASSRAAGDKCIFFLRSLRPVAPRPFLPPQAQQSMMHQSALLIGSLIEQQRARQRHSRWWAWQWLARRRRAHQLAQCGGDVGRGEEAGDEGCFRGGAVDGCGSGRGFW